MGMFLLTLQKIPVSLSFIVTEIWPGQNTNSKSFFWPKLPKFLAKLNFNFSLHNFSRYVIFGFFGNFFARKVLGDMARTRKALQTDGRTDGHTRREKQYVSRRGRHIIILIFSTSCPTMSTTIKLDTKLSEKLSLERYTTA